nr:acyl-CoA dehydrogenase domain-containing protein [Neisseria weixii]
MLTEINALQKDDVNAFDRAFQQHLGQSTSNAARSFVFGLTHGGGYAPKSPLAFAYKRLNRLSAAFAFAADVAMLSLGGDLKRRESLSGRLADAFSNLYIASACLNALSAKAAVKPICPLPNTPYAWPCMKQNKPCPAWCKTCRTAAPLCSYT